MCTDKNFHDCCERNTGLKEQQGVLPMIEPILKSSGYLFL